MKKFLPKLYHYFYNVLETPEIFWLTKIILSLFLFSFDIPECTRIWDYFLSRGSLKTFIEITISILDHL
jgi:hypothetical protein